MKLTICLLSALLMMVVGIAQPSRKGTPRGTIAHQANLNWSNSSCTTSKPCQIQVYRAVCSGPTSCPSYPGSAFAQPPSATLAVTVNASATGTTWQVVDTDPNLGDATTYVYVATNSFTGTSLYSPPSAPWSGTTAAAPATAPPAPVMGTGNTIQ